MNKLRNLRKNNRLAQEAVAVELGVTQGAVSQWEKGETFPKTELLPKLAKLYNCTIDELLCDNADKSA